jgi:hypothetical protein
MIDEPLCKGDLVQLSIKSTSIFAGMYGKIVEEHPNGVDFYVDFGKGAELFFYGLLKKVK